MVNLYHRINTRTDYYKQFRCGESLITLFNCPLEHKFQDLWSEHNYFVYVVDGRKIWHTGQGSYDLRKGDCVFVRKGACIVEQFIDTTTCYIFFFMPDDFIRDVLENKPIPQLKAGAENPSVISVENNAITHSFFASMISYFESNNEPAKALLELKFKELVLTLADNAGNNDLRHYFSLLLQQPRSIALQQIMEDNFRFNLKLDEFARLSARSLSAFKRDFESVYQTTPGKWLLEKRLQHALSLLSHKGRTVSEAAFESGFESPSHFSRVFRQRFGYAAASVKHQATV